MQWDAGVPYPRSHRGVANSYRWTWQAPCGNIGLDERMLSTPRKARIDAISFGRPCNLIAISASVPESRPLDTVALQPGVKASPRQLEGFGGPAHISLGAVERRLDDPDLETIHLLGK